MDYMALGLWDDAHALLARRYPSAGVVAEPGTALPQDYPLVAYYRGYCAEKVVRFGGRLRLASGQWTRHVFPTVASLSWSSAGTEAESGGRHRPLPPRVGSSPAGGRRRPRRVGEGALAGRAAPVLHRNIGFTHLYARGAAGDALRVFEEGMGADPTNVELYQGADQALTFSAAGPRSGSPRCGGIPRRRCLRRSSSSWPSPSPRRGASPRRRRSSRGASSPARSSGRTCARSTSR